jgi:hypothetical protein
MPRLQVGYCSGVKYVVRHLRLDQRKINVGYCPHPSLLEKDELRDIKGQFAIIWRDDWRLNSPLLVSRY